MADRISGNPHTAGPLRELQLLERLFDLGGDNIRVETISGVAQGQHKFPLYCVRLGNPDPATPKIALVGGVHGLERIGSQIVIAYLETLISRLAWDDLLRRELEAIELIVVPVVNPVGMYKGWRANGEGVDIMRNAPVDAEERVSFLVGGHRLGGWLPWYRGRRNQPLQVETQMLIDVIEQYLLPAPFSMVLDVHSGFGMENRLWFPYAGSTRPPEHLAEYFALKQLFATAFPHQNYLFEPQSRHYLTHGDLWDYLYVKAQHSNTVFLPLTLELGSWRWVKKNPLQITSLLGLFNPVAGHRVQRTLRGHIVLLEFLLRATLSWRAWLPGEAARAQLRRDALECWYE